MGQLRHTFGMPVVAALRSVAVESLGCIRRPIELVPRSRRPERRREGLLKAGYRRIVIAEAIVRVIGVIKSVSEMNEASTSAQIGHAARRKLPRNWRPSLQCRHGRFVLE